MDLLGGIMSDMNKENPASNNRSTSSGSSSHRHSAQAPRKSYNAAVTRREEEEKPSTSRPPAIFNKRPLSTHDERRYDPEVKREKTDDTFTNQQSLRVQTNQYQIDLTKMPEIVERFHLDIFATNIKGKTFEVNGEVKVTGELAKQNRRWALWNIWKQIIKTNPNLFNNEIDLNECAYDCGSSAYFKTGVYIGGDETTITLEKEDFGTPEWKPISKLLRSEIKVITVVIVRNKSNGKIYTRGANFLRPENRGELIRFLEVLTSQITNNRHYYQFGNTTFIRSGDERIDHNTEPIDDEGKEVKTGFEKALRLVADRHGQAKVVMTIDTRRCPFYQEQNVLEMLKALYNINGGGGGGNRGGYGGNHGGNRGGYGGNYGGQRGGGFGGHSRDGQGRHFNGGDRRRDEDGDRRSHQYQNNDTYRQGSNRSGGDYRRDNDRSRGERDNQGSSSHNGRNHRGNEESRHERRPDRDHSHQRRDERRNRDDEDTRRIDGDIEKILRIMGIDGQERTDRKLNELKNVAVTPKHLPSTKLNHFYIYGFVHTPADQFMIPREDGSEISMYQYYLEKYNIRLAYPGLPLAAQKKGQDGVICYPLELLNIERGQRVKQQNITQKTQRQLTGMLPLKHIQITEHVLQNELKIDVKDNKFLKNFNVHISEEPTKMSARILSAPVINFYNRSTIQPNTGCRQKPQINLNSSARFARSAELDEIWIINFDNVLSRENQGNLCYAIEQACKSQNITFRDRSKDWKIINCYESDHDKLKDVMKEAKGKDISLLLAVTKEQRPDVHDVLKLFESQIGVQTQQIALKTANALMASGGNKTTMENVLRKLNVKCGGLNYTVSVPRNLGSKTICDNYKNVQKMFFDNTLLIGFELAHAGATCLFDRQNNIACGEPSVVGYSYSCGDPCDLGGYNYLQKPREHSLMYLPRHMSMILSNYMSAKKTLPEKVVIYRSGVGEGDFEKVAGEVEQMKSVFETDEKFRGKKIPQFLMVVVSKTSHMRIYPGEVNGKTAFDQNVPSGTCVASEITAYGLNEFYLVSQSAGIGTTRPARYTVVVNDLKWSINEIAHLSYFLAFAHQVSSQPPGIPNVLYAAGNMAKRGRTNFKTHQKLQRAVRGNRNDGREDDENGTMMEELSDQLNRCALNCKNFWA